MASSRKICGCLLGEASGRLAVCAQPAAAGGFAQVVETLRDPTSQVQLIVCAEGPRECERCRVTPIVIPPLAARADEIDRIIHEYAHDAMVELEAPRRRSRQPTMTGCASTPPAR